MIPIFQYLCPEGATATLIRGVVIFGLAAPTGALAARSDWSNADRSQLRLLLSEPEQGRIQGGVEILLEPGWYTYWRNPGEAGLPPVFDFSASDNVAGVEVLYPAPERYDDGASVSLIYRDEVVFPLAVTAVNPGEPVTLRVDASFGVCREICIPTQTDSEVTLSPWLPPDPLSKARIAGYLPRVPKAPEPGRFAVAEIEIEADALLIDILMPDTSYADLFAEPPPGWNLGQPKLISRAGGIARFRLPLAGRPRGSEVSGQEFRFVAVAGGEAIEESVTNR
ncbi:MAG: hypothetical protein M3453_10130 [Pseudomonadota bacterium]|nr:hypothetical protein [Pseudomonadota bacterium]